MKQTRYENENDCMKVRFTNLKQDPACFTQALHPFLEERNLLVGC